MRPHVLLTAWAFAPARTSGVYRAIGLANAFAEHDWDVTVLTAPRSVFASEGMVDDSLSAQVAACVRVVEVPFSSMAYSSDITSWGWMRARHPELWGLVRARRFPEPAFGDWRSALERTAVRVHREHPVDLAFGTANPSVDFMPGWELKRRFDVPCVMDYRDAWTIDVFTGERQSRVGARAEAWERRLIEAADQMWFVNEPIRSWHSSKYPDASAKMHVVPNGFDIVGGASPAVPFRETPRDRPLTFGYIGTINTGQFPTEVLLEGWRRARTISDEIARARIVLKGHLGRTGVADAALEDYLRRADAEGIHYEGPVAKADVAATYAGFDGLVLALASGPGVTSGKVFEFAGTGLPVISVHDPDSAATAIMAGSPVWTPAASLRADDIAQAFVATAATIRAQTADTRAEAIRWGEQWERMRQLSGPVGALSELVKRSPAR